MRWMIRDESDKVTSRLFPSTVGEFHLCQSAGFRL
jgi:hypothetical protein